MRMIASARNAFVAAPGLVWASLDYAAQEIRVAAALSGDQELVGTYLLEKSQPFLVDADGNPLLRSNGKPFKNPKTDVYIQTAIPIFSQLQNLSDTELEDAANKKLPNGGTPRKKAKTLFLGIIYGMAAASLAGRINVDRKEAEKMIQLFFAKYSSLEQFLLQSQFEAKQQRYVKNALGRIIFVNEANAKGLNDGGTVARKGANAKIQSLSSDMTKLGMIRVHRAFQKINDRRRSLNPGCEIATVGFPVHDELNSLIPGEVGVRFEEDEKNPELVIPVSFIHDPPTAGEEVALEYQAAKQEGMESAMRDILSPIIQSKFGVEFPAKVEVNLHYYWKH